MAPPLWNVLSIGRWWPGCGRRHRQRRGAVV